MKNTIVVSDTTAITHLARIDALHLIQKLYLTIYIPEAVFSELTDNGDHIAGAKEVVEYDWIRVKKVQEHSTVTYLSDYLDPGECEAITLAKEMNADLLIIDEKEGRYHAKSMGLNITGMIGILLKAKEKKLIPAVRPYLDRLIATRFKLHLNLYNQALILAGEMTNDRHA